MGLCQSKEEQAQHKRSQQIDASLTLAYELDRKVAKLLLLGSAECGKSTLIKQMRILHANGFTRGELLLHRDAVYSNTVEAMGEMLGGMRALHLAFDEACRVEDARVVERVLEEEGQGQGDWREGGFTEELAGALRRLWADSGLHNETFSRRMEFHPHVSAKYFFDNLERISTPDYCPTHEDVLMIRVRTTGITEVDFDIKGAQLRVVDVGGQRSERKKWIHCFDKVNAVIFISAVSEYDQSLADDASANRLLESMGLFDSICNSRWFLDASIILFLNKKDVFEEKLHFTPISTCFPRYTGTPESYDESIDYIKAKFEQLNRNPMKPIYVHQTCATDTKMVESILDSVITMVLEQSLHRSGFN